MRNTEYTSWVKLCSPRPAEEAPGKHGNTATGAGQGASVLNFEISKSEGATSGEAVREEMLLFGLPVGKRQFQKE